MSERINWLSGTPHQTIVDYSKWRDAVQKADAGILSDVVALLKSEIPIGPDARDLVADLLSRHTLAKKKGGQKNPRYKVTTREGELRMAQKLVAYYRGKGLSAEDAIRQALRDNKREALDLANDTGAYTDDDLDEMVSPEDFDILENRVKRNRKSG